MIIKKHLFMILLTTVLCLFAITNIFAASFDYKNGIKFETTDGSYSFEPGILLQPQYTYTGVTDGGTDVATFRVRRARFFIGGKAFAPTLKYYIGIDTPGTAGGASASLEQGYLDYTPYSYLGVRFGQFKTPFDRELLTASYASQFVDASLAYTTFTPNIDMGLNVHGEILNKKLEYNVFLMNGSGANTIDPNNEPVIGSRLVWYAMGKHDYTQSDVNDVQKPELALAIAGLYDSSNSALANDKIFRLTSDVAFRYKGFSFLGAGYVVKNKTDDATDYGFLTQAGIFFIPKKFELALRGDGVIRSTVGAFGTGPVNTYETGIATSYYINGHRLKLQSDYNLLWNNGLVQNQDDHRVRVQATLMF